MNRRDATQSGDESDEVRRDEDDVAPQAGIAAKTPASAKSARVRGRKAAGRGSADVGQMLRGAYRLTVEEAVPDDLMDLLNKLD